MKKSIILVFITFLIASCGGGSSGDNKGLTNPISTASSWDQGEWDTMEWE